VLILSLLSFVWGWHARRCLQYVIGAIFRDIHIWSATGDNTGSGIGSGYHLLAAGNANAPGQALATLATPVGVVADFYVIPGDQVSRPEFNLQRQYLIGRWNWSQKIKSSADNATYYVAVRLKLHSHNSIN